MPFQNLFKYYSSNSGKIFPIDVCKLLASFILES